MDGYMATKPASLVGVAGLLTCHFIPLFPHRVVRLKNTHT